MNDDLIARLHNAVFCGVAGQSTCARTIIDAITEIDRLRNVVAEMAHEVSAAELAKPAPDDTAIWDEFAGKAMCGMLASGIRHNAGSHAQLAGAYTFTVDQRNIGDAP